MRGRNIIVFILFVVFTACQVNPGNQGPITNQHLEQKILGAIPDQSTQQNDSSDAVPSLTLAPSLPDATATATATATVTATATATASATPNIAPLNAVSIANLKKIKVVDIPVPDRLQGELTWSPDDRQIIVQTDKGFEVLDSEDLALISEFPGLNPVQFQKDGRLLVQSGEELQLMNIDSGSIETVKLPVPLDSPDSVYALSHDGRQMAIAPVFNPDKGWQELKIVNMDDGSIMGVTYWFNESYLYFSRLVFTPDDRVLLADSIDKGITVTLLISPRDGVQYSGRLETNYRISVDSKRAVGGGGMDVSLFIPESGGKYASLMSNYEKQVDEDRSLEYTTTAYDFWGSSDKVGIFYQVITYDKSSNHREFTGEIWVWDADTSTIDETLDGLPAGVQDLRVSNDGSRFVLVTTDQFLSLWSVDGLKQLAATNAYGGRNEPILDSTGENVVFDLSFQPVIYSLITGEVSKLPGYENVLDVQPSSMVMKRLFIKVSPLVEEPYLDIWDLAQGQSLGKITKSTACTAPEAGNLVICQLSNTIVYNTETGETLHHIGTSGLEMKTAISSDGRLFSHCVLKANKIGIWDTLSGERVQDLEGTKPQIGADTLFSPDGSILVSGTGFVWDVGSGSLISEIKLQESPGDVIAISPNNMLVIIDRSVYNIYDGSLLFTFPDPFTDARFSSDGSQIIYVLDRQAFVWGVAP